MPIKLVVVPDRPFLCWVPCPFSATEAEVIAAVEDGERFPAKRGQTGFRRNFAFGGEWRGRHYETKQIEAFAVEEDGWLVISLVVRFL